MDLSQYKHQVVSSLIDNVNEEWLSDKETFWVADNDAVINLHCKRTKIGSVHNRQLFLNIDIIHVAEDFQHSGFLKTFLNTAINSNKLVADVKGLLISRVVNQFLEEFLIRENWSLVETGILTKSYAMIKNNQK